MPSITLTHTEITLLLLIINGAIDDNTIDLSMAVPDQEARQEFTRTYLHRYFPEPTAPIHRDYDFPYYKTGSIAYYLNDRIKEQLDGQ